MIKKKKDIKIWLTYYTLTPSFSLTLLYKSSSLKNSCLATHSGLDIKSSPSLGGPHSTQQPSPGPGDEGAPVPFHWSSSLLCISFNCPVCRQIDPFLNFYWGNIVCGNLPLIFFICHAFTVPSAPTFSL